MLFTRPAGAAVTVMYDPGAMMDAYNAAAQLITHFLYVYVAKLPGKIDPGEATRKQARKTHDAAMRFTGQRAPRALEAVKKSREKLSKRYTAK